MTLESMPRADALHDPARLHPSIALAPYVEALVAGRRVAVLGDGSLGLADALHARGARLVHAYDPDPARVAEMIARRAPAFGSAAAGRPAARGVVHALLGDDLGVRDGAFDAVLIPDLCAFQDRVDVVRRARKLVAPTGAVVIASPNGEAKRRLTSGPAAPDTLGYYEIFDLLQLQFPVVRMVGQAPFVGYAIVDFSPDREPDVSFDASLMAGTEEPEIFVAIASERPISLDPYLVVEVPAARVLGVGAAFAAARAEEAPFGPASDRGREAVRANDPVQLAEMQARIVLMEAELDDLRSQKGDLARQLDATRAELSAAAGRERDVARETHARAEEASRVAGADADRLRELAARAGDEHVRAERLTHKVRDLEEELVHQRDRAQKLTKQLDDEKRARQKAEIELGMTRGLPKEGEADAARIEELTAALRNAKAHADSLASELLAKSKETAELRREHEAAEEKNVALRKERAGLEAKMTEATSERDAAVVKAAELARERDHAAARIADLTRERDAASARMAETARALIDAQAKLDDLEGEAQTIRRPQVFREPVVVTGEVQSNMVARITRLEATANAEKQAAAEARKDADEARKDAAESKRAHDQAVAQRDQAIVQRDHATAQRDAAIARADKLEKALAEERAERKDLVAAKAALESEVIGLKRRIDEVASESESEVGPEVTHLEAALRDRGHRIAQLERDLRESERIGRELIQEVEALRAEAGVGGGSGSNQGAGGGSQNAPTNNAGGRAQASGVDAMTASAFQHRIDMLAADAAQKQAELLSSTWRIQALERELSEAREAAGDPSQKQRELSSALVRAQSEIADLRRALTANGGAVPRQAIEDQVLLHQQMSR
ncbi:MAG: hypothetical protein U0441_07545 [Polyangiaceae bacterium]